MQVILTQKNRVRAKDEEAYVLNRLAYHSARLYNVGLYSVRQHFFANKKYLGYSKNYHDCKGNENYALLLSDMAQPILRLVDRNFKSFFGLLKKKKQGAYDAKVRLPKYKGKEECFIVPICGRSARVKQNRVEIGLSKAFRERYKPSFKELSFPLPENIGAKTLQEVRILPKCDGKEFEIEYVYKKEIKPHTLDVTKHVSVDFGVSNFAACFSSNDGSSFLIDGRYIKSINRRYNKELSKLQSIKEQQAYRHTTKRIHRLTTKRQNRINDYFNRTVKYLTDYCVNHNVGTLVLGDFEGIKQGANLGKRNNQNFVQIPYGKFKQKLSSRCEQLGIALDSVSESHTSKCSFLDQEEVCHHDSYLGKRIKRGLFRAQNKVLVNADTNGAANTLTKFLKSKHRLGELIFERVRNGFVNNPVRVKLSDMLNSSSKAQAIALA